MTKTVSTVSAFASVASAFIGRLVAIAAADGATQTYKVASLSDKIGSLKDGSKGEYVVLQNSADEAVVISLHPQKAKVLFAKGEEGAMSLVAEKKLTEAEYQAAANAIAATLPETDGAAAEEAKAPSKKALFMEVYNAGVAAGKARKDIKADASALNLSDAGFNTYYQNAKSGKWA